MKCITFLTKSKVYCLLVTWKLKFVSINLEIFYKEKKSCHLVSTHLVSEIIALYSKMAARRGAEISTLIKPFLLNTLHSICKNNLSLCEWTLNTWCSVKWAEFLLHYMLLLFCFFLSRFYGGIIKFALEVWGSNHIFSFYWCPAQALATQLWVRYHPNH